MDAQLNIQNGEFVSAMYQVTKMLVMKEPHTAEYKLGSQNTPFSVGLN